MPREAAANQSRQTCREGDVGSIRLTAIAAPTAPIADPIAVAPKKPSTRCTSSSLNVLPNQRSSSQAVRSACPALMELMATANHALLPIMRLQTVLAITTAAATGRRTPGPHTTSAPTAMPAAGQKTATPGSARRAKPSRPARKYAMPVATATFTTPSHERLATERERCTPAFPGCVWVVGLYQRLRFV